MNEYVKLIIEDIKKLWNNLDLNQKFSLAALALVGIVAAVFFIVKATEPNWSILYSDLVETDIAAITESLKKSGYAYKISDDKKAILVPADKKEELKMFVAENSLIQDSSPGFELLDNLQLGSTDFKNQMTKQRIFQGELTRSIEKIKGISKARVQLAEPERSVFSDEDEDPSASVILILEPGYRIKAAQVTAIKNLVAYSVPRLSADRVFLTDQYGNMLSEDVSKNSSDMHSFKTNFERDASKKIKETLETIMGRRNVSVQVSADLDFDAKRSTIESYIPASKDGKGILVTSTGEKEIYQNPNGAANTVKETSSETATGDASAPSTTVERTVQNGKNLSYEKEKSAANYAVTKEVKQVVYAPGSVKRITVAVAVNKILTPEEKTEIETLVQAAAGMDSERGDVVTVTSLKFSSDATPLEEQKKAEKEAATTYLVDLFLTKIAPLLVLLVLGIVALNTIGNILKRPGSGYNDLVEEIDYGPDPFLVMQEHQAAQVDDLPQISAFNTIIERKKSDITEAIIQDPEEAARVLTSYIRE